MARKPTKTPSALDELLEQAGRGIGELFKGRFEQIGDGIKVLGDKLDASQKERDALRQEVDELKARPTITPSSVQAFLRGVKEGMK
jgi:hypothetical protein